MFINDALSVARYKFAETFSPKKYDMFHLIFSTLDPAPPLTEEEVERLNELIESIRREQDKPDSPCE